MQELEERGLLTHPHTSAGRIPTESGLRLFVDGIMHSRAARAARARGDRGADHARPAGRGGAGRRDRDAVGPVGLRRRGARPEARAAPEAAELRPAEPRPRAGGAGRNRRQRRKSRASSFPAATSAVALAEVANYVNARLAGLTLGEAEARLRAEIRERREAIDAAAAELVARGLADWSEDHAQRPVLIVRGQANLIDETAAADLERVRSLLDELEDRQEIARLLEGAREGQGCRIFIGQREPHVRFVGLIVIAAPYRGSEGQVVGVVGVIGPTRLNYARVVPMVDFTAQALTRFMR